VDIHFQPTAANETYSNKVFTFGFISSLKVWGLQALVNRWAKTFMTPVGSDPLHPDTGTSFAALIGVNVNQDNPDIEDAVVLAIDDTNEQLTEQESNGAYPTNESLGYAKLTAIAYDPTSSSVSIWVEISNKLNESLTLKLVELADR
jgi:hypothetical protein